MRRNFPLSARRWEGLDVHFKIPGFVRAVRNPLPVGREWPDRQVGKKGPLSNSGLPAVSIEPQRPEMAPSSGRSLPRIRSGDGDVFPSKR